MDDFSHSDQDGLHLNELKLVSHNTRWTTMYANEAKLLVDIPKVRDVMHIGSTALPNVDTKPIIDIALLVNGNPDDETVRDSLAERGYACHGEYGLPGRQFYTKGSPANYHLHVVNDTTPHWCDWKDFRNYLLAHPDWCKKYQEEKYRIAKAVNWNRERYTEAKSDFVQLVLEKARAS